MISKLSVKYQKEIALGFMSLFFVAGLGTVKAGIPNGRIPALKTERYFNAYPSLLSSKKQLTRLMVPEVLEKMSQHTEAVLTANLPVKDKFTVKAGNVGTNFIGGPGQPEMSAFKSVGSDNMVSPFTGDFSYNIPLLDVGGYPVNIFYNSGVTMDQDASWVGLGWNINPGTITRNMRGLPDDFDGTDLIKKTQSIKPDKTWGVSGSADIKFAGFPFIGFGVSAGISFNNRLGVATEAGIHPSLSISGKSGDNMTASLSASVNLNASARNGASLTPSINVGLQQTHGQNGNLSGSLGLSYSYNSRMGLTAMHLDAGVSKSRNETYQHGNIDLSGSKSYGTFSSSISFAYPSIVPSTRSILTRKNYNLSFSMGGEIYSINVHGRLGGYYSESKIADKDKVINYPAYGMLNYQKGNNDPNAMLDFNRANDGIYTPNSPAIGMPVYTYDVFSINGEGTGGVFRATRSDLGYMRDAKTKTREDAASVGVDLGFGNIVHGGAQISYAYTPSEAGAWEVNNSAKDVFKFTENKNDYQAVYFRNPGEKTIPDATFQNNIGGEDLVRLKLANIASGTPLLLPRLIKYNAGKHVIGEQLLTTASVIKANRDKRSQVISFLTAEESERLGFDKYIYSYKSTGIDSNKIIFSTVCNSPRIDTFYRYSQAIHAEPLINQGEGEDFRKKNHISQIDVLGTDGRKYVYGLPVYNINQVDVSFSVNKSQANTATSKVSYESDDDSEDNKKGRDWFIEQQEMPAYTHSFLLTSLVSPNYVDVTSNGVTDDDKGDAIKFNYSKFDNYKWRTPVGDQTATYSEGLKTDIKDDKAHYVYGEREMWHLYSIESKNMVARFYVKNDRKDARAVVGKTGALNANWGMQRLDKISLYSKGDLMRYGSNAKPIKTIRFFQSYKLCKNTASGSELGSTSLSSEGKLTLDSIWVTYNGNLKKAKSRYVFYYPSGNNPDYNFNANDRWGNYKPESDGGANNQGSLANSDYPYSIQDKTKADKYAAAWTMNKILLPSGAVISIDYEADTYAYVQNRRATTMMEISGFGNTDSPDATQKINPYLYTGSLDCDRVYIKLPYAITNSNAIDAQRELAERYFTNLNQLFLKLWVKMPDKAGIPGSEAIGIYADIERFGLVPGTSGTLAFVKVKSVVGNTSPMVQQSLQFLKHQLPGKAYKGYDVSDEAGAQAIVTALAGMITSVGALIDGDDETLKKNRKCREVTTEKSFVRLDNPYYNKYGGGLRVKKVTIHDNWKKMTNQSASTYGQEYKYTTNELVNGKMIAISSGVAAWEPSIGSDENPFKEIMRYMDHNKGGPYDFGAIEMPLGEMFYPSAMVGYSKIEVLSIHRDTVKNLPTRQVTEFFTTREFPYVSTSTQLNDPEANVKYEPKKIMQLLKLDMKKAITLSQGFLVDINDMNGKEKRQATYSALDSVNPVSYTQNYYNVKQKTDKTYAFNHMVPTINKPDGIVQNSVLGRDIELMADFRQHKTETISTNININFDLFILGWFPIPIFNPLQPFIRESTTYRSASLLKVVNHYGILDSVVVVDKGSMVSTKNLVYDAETGNTLLTRTQNEHNKPVYNFSYPAHWAYSGMGPAYKNIDAVYPGLNFRHGKLENPPSPSIFESGDEIYVLAQNNKDLSATPPCDNNAGTDPWTTLKKNPAKKIWALYTGKVGAAVPQMVFMDAEGNPYNAVDASVRIVRSGHRNMLDQIAGSITSLNYPINSSNHLVFNDTTSIIQTGAATFRDHWRVDNSMYTIDSAVKQVNYARVKRLVFGSVDSLDVTADKVGSGSFGYSASKNKFLHLHKKSRRASSGNHSEKHATRSFLLFDFNNSEGGTPLPSNAIFYKAYLSIFSHTNELVKAPSANHPNFHGSSRSHDINRLAEIKSLKNSWFSASSPNQWGSYYFATEQHLSSQSAIVPISTLGFESYLLQNNGISFNDTRIPLSNLVTGNAGSVLAESRKIGLQLKLTGDIPPDEPGNDECQRCFWSHKQAGNKSHNGGPALTYYYYICGDTSVSSVPDPYVNTMIRCDSVTIMSTLCLSKYSRKAINPYVEGILGNWRVDSTYAYYGERKETDPSSLVDTRTGGTIVNFKTFWNFNSNGFLIRNQSASSVWVWNSTITQYNRKGYEIENKDALGRYNSGLYGYNQQLPVAVANNARVREIMFDGYEDYDYQTSQDCISCKPSRHFTYDSAVAAKLDSSQRHTGRYSLKLGNSQNVSLSAPVTSTVDADKDFSLRIRMDSVLVGADTVVISKGTGWSAKYAGFYGGGGWSYPDPDVFGTVQVSRFETSVNLQCQSEGSCSSGPPSEVNYQHGYGKFYKARWEGYIQPTISGTYYFRTYSDDGVRVKIGSTAIINDWNEHVGAYNSSSGTTMLKGNVYKLQMDFFQAKGPAYAVLMWKVPGMSDYANIPYQLVYPPEKISDTAGSVIRNTQMYCTRLDSVNVRGNALTDTFSLIQGKKMLFSAWVKENTSDCKCSTYVNNTVIISYTGSGQTETLHPTGSIIEGWQRYESVFMVPSAATKIKVKLNNGGSAPVYFDDVRIQPFNANLKSFVYHSSNLRLMSELDENNYASFYEYDDDGTLTRVKKETQKGIKTITETRSAMQKTINE